MGLGLWEASGTYPANINPSPPSRAYIRTGVLLSFRVSARRFREQNFRAPEENACAAVYCDSSGYTRIIAISEGKTNVTQLCRKIESQLLEYRIPDKDFGSIKLAYG